jgi:glyoxylase-like metal-dependent hydrolase (beta-lactamase superfamily II)
MSRTTISAAPSAPANDELIFPFADYPEPGTATEVADGIFWLSTKVPFVALKQVNLWLLRDGPGWTMIDCGYGKPDVQEQLLQAWSSVLGGRPITRLIVTHFHPDHAGNSGFIAAHWGLRPLMSQGEWFTANMARADMDTDAMKSRERFYCRHGLPQEQARKFIAEVLPYKDGVELPRSYKRLRGGEFVSINNDRWQVIVGEGHSPEHVSLNCAERRILIAGDQILPTITTNVSTWPGEPEFDAVGAFLTSCKNFLDLLDPETLILPSHRKPFLNVRHRLRDLAVHHAERLNLMLAGAGRETSAGEMIDVLFRSGLDGHQIGFAMGEIIAHLNHLVVLGHMKMIETLSQVRYRRISDASAKVEPHFL